MNPAASDTVVVVIEAVDVGNVVVDVGRAAMEAFALRCFAEAAATAEDARARAPLMAALRLYAASRLERSSAFHLEHGGPNPRQPQS